MSFEKRLARLIVGSDRVSPLLSDAYKWSMAQAGYPLRSETFVLSYRKGGSMYVPFDTHEVLQHLRPDSPTFEEMAFLDSQGYSMSPSMREALKGDLDVWSSPSNRWANQGHPVATLSGPSFLVSWYESLAICLNFPIQVATALMRGQTQFTATCEDEASIIRLVASEMVFEAQVMVNEEGYRQAVRKALSDVREAVGGNADMIFECGTRAMTCYQMHRICLEECRRMGVTKTANVLGAWELNMVPVGTTGHEHQQRHLYDDDGFRAIRDSRPGAPSYLFDTTDTYKSGIPSALKVLREENRRASVRFDSGDHEKQLGIFAEEYHKDDLLAENLFFIFMDGYNASRTARMQRVCDQLGIPDGAENRMYGFGSYLVTPAKFQVFTRNALAMVYKLSRSGTVPVMKDNGTKSSLPGEPIVMALEEDSNIRIVAQQGEKLEGYVYLENSDWRSGAFGRDQDFLRLSPLTKALIGQCKTRKANYIASLEGSA